MSSWAPNLSGWKEEEIDSLVEFVSGYNKNLHKWNDESGEGKAESGRNIFEQNCEMCHGSNGRGGIALALNKVEFLSLVSEGYIIQTILNGRNNTAMPSWYDLSQEEMNDLISYFRSWDGQISKENNISLPHGDSQKGFLNYHYFCSRCHGEFGEGDTGPSILNRRFLEAASNSYLYETIGQGRSHTAMFGWLEDVHGDERLDDQDISDIVAFMRSTANKEWNYIYAGSNPGKAAEGETLFTLHCAECHGDRGEGVEAPALNNQEFLSAASNGYILGTISLGRSNTRMPSWGRGDEEHPTLEGKERQDIVAYIRNWQRIRIKYKVTSERD